MPQIDLTEAIHDFGDMVNQFDQIRPQMDLDVQHLSQKELPAFVFQFEMSSKRKREESEVVITP